MTTTATAPTTSAEANRTPSEFARLPRLPVNGRFGRGEIDRRAAGVALSALDGAVSEAHARRVIAALLYGSSIPETVATHWSGDRQVRADIADRLRLLLFTKAMQQTAGGLLVDRLAGGASASGWATQLCRAALPSAARDVRARQRERPHPTVGGGRDDDAPQHFRSITEVLDLVSPAAPDISDGDALGRDESADSSAVAGLSVLSGMRSGSRRHRGSVHLRRALGVPAPKRPVDPVVRQRIAAVLERDEVAARRSVYAELARRRGAVSECVNADDPLVVLWLGYPEDALLILANRDHRYAHVVVSGAVVPRPAIRADIAAALAGQVRRAEPCDPAWGDLAAGLVAAFLAHISDVPSEFSPAHRTATPKSAEEKLSETDAFAKFLDQAASHPAAPLGSVPAMVEAEMHERLAIVEAVVADLRRRPAA